MSTKVSYSKTWTDPAILFSVDLNANFNDIKNFCEKSNDATLATASATAMTTEYAVKTYVTNAIAAAMAAITLSADLSLDEYGIALKSALTADGKYSGLVLAGTAGATLAFGDLCYLQTSDSRWELTDADAEATACNTLGICVLAASADGSATKMLLWGGVRADTAFPTLTIGAPVYVSTDAGDITVTAPSGAADIIRKVGYGLTADSLLFWPSPNYIEHS